MKRDATPALVGSDELAEGLMLVRASTLKMIRFQLAMERRDRRVALETVDDLVALDRRLDQYLADVPSAQLMFRNELEAERAVLNQEKLTLAAEVIRGEPKPVEVAVEPAQDGAGDDFAFEEEERPSRAAWWLVAILLLVSAAAAAAYWFAGAATVAGIWP